MVFKKLAATLLSAVMAVSALSVISFADEAQSDSIQITNYQSEATTTKEWDGKTELDSTVNYTVSKKITLSGQYVVYSSLTIKKGGSITLNKDAALSTFMGGKLVVEKGGKLIAKSGSGIMAMLGGSISIAGTAEIKSGAALVGLYSAFEITKGGKISGKGIGMPLLTATTGKGKSTLTGLYMFKSVTKSQAKAYVKPVDTLLSGIVKSDFDTVMTSAIPSSVYKKLKPTLEKEELYSELIATLDEYKAQYIGTEEDALEDIEIYVSGYAKLSSTAKKKYVKAAEELLTMAGSKLKVTDARAVQVGLAYAGDDEAYKGEKYDSVINLVIVKIDGKWYLSTGYLQELQNGLSMLQ